MTPFSCNGEIIAIEMGAELLDPTQQLNRPRLLVVIEKKRLMCTTHSASLREQPNGWWI